MIIAAVTFALMMLPVVTNNLPTVNAQSQSQQTQPPPHITSQAPQNTTTPQPGVQFIFNNKSLPANAPEFCASMGQVVSGKAIPDYNLCDVVVYRQMPPITRNDGFVINNFSGIGHYIELQPAVINNTQPFAAAGVNGTAPTANQQNNNNNLTVAFGEFALLDSEVVPVRQVMNKYNWTETALHHHMLNETPKILFLHWTVTGQATDLINQAKEMIMQTSTYQNQTGNTRTPSSAGP
jgi:hypothetical protein